MSSLPERSIAPIDNLRQAEAEARAALFSHLVYTVELSLSDDPDVPTFESVSTVEFEVAEDGAESFANLSATSIKEVLLNGAPVPDALDGYDGARLPLRG